MRRPICALCVLCSVLCSVTESSHFDDQTLPNVTNRYTNTIKPLHNRYTTVTRPLHDRYTTVTQPLWNDVPNGSTRVEDVGGGELSSESFHPPVTRPSHVRYTSVTRRLHVRYTSVTRPLHVRYTSVTRPLHVRYTPQVHVMFGTCSVGKRKAVF